MVCNTEIIPEHENVTLLKSKWFQSLMSIFWSGFFKVLLVLGELGSFIIKQLVL